MTDYEATARSTFSGRIVFVADVFDETSDTAPMEKRRDMEKSTQGTIDAVMGGIIEAGYGALHIDNLGTLEKHLRDHPTDLVLSTYGGERSRSRTCLVPGLCELLNVPFIGLDAYGQAICHDKAATKSLAEAVGLRTPPWRVFYQISPMDLLQDFEIPFILKPLSEGSSIGISNSNIITDLSKAESKAIELMSELSVPVMAEKFIGGAEVAYCSLQDGAGTINSFNEVQVEGDPNYFEDKVWDASEKFRSTVSRRVVSIDDKLHPDDRAALHRLLTALGAYDYIRIDGRLKNGRFHFLEATPDAYLGPGGQFAKGLGDQGLVYSEIIDRMARSALSRLPDLRATG